VTKNFFALKNDYKMVKKSFTLKVTVKKFWSKNDYKMIKKIFRLKVTVKNFLDQKRLWNGQNILTVKSD